MKKLFRILVTLLVAISLVACSNGGGSNGGETAGEKTKVVFWHTLTDHQFDMTDEIVKAFNASQDKYEVEHIAQPRDGFEAKVYETVTNGTGPNIVWLYPGTASDYVEEGLALDYGKYFTDADYKDRVGEDLYAASTDYPDGKLHAVLGSLTGPIMWYNGDLLAKYNLEVPETWDDLLAACKTVVDGEKAEGNNIIGFGPDSIDTVGTIVLAQSGLKFIDENRTANDWVDPKFVEFVDWWKAAEQEGYFQLKGEEDYHSVPFANGSFFCYAGSCAGLKHIMDAKPQFDVVTGIYPQMTDGTPYEEATFRALVGFTKSEAEDEATAEFVKFFVNAENNAKFVQLYDGASPYKDSQQINEYKEYVANSIGITAMNKMAAYTAGRTAVSGASACKTAITAGLLKAITDNQDTVASLEAAVAEANAALSE